MEASSSLLVHNESKNSCTSPFSGHFRSRNFAHISVWANMPFSLYLYTIASHHCFTVILEQTRISVELGSFWVSKNFANRSSFSHASIAVFSAAVGALGVAAAGVGSVPLKWPQNPFASTAS